ncbi:hypothetical protein, variant 1 [Aphanomyces astaci]|uniref:Uncharacterized protein n=1 Tax=Aphanomyces astaci TaxID=112090 RepID=W4H5M3_APHAT|nr:hypothetical protein, variant 1 [Aphanomyces astaci]ETV87207.1 hypothetical protein, variant 1 [Aphanomyces astaci]|eukprot:XP_009824007.1 hypothetical protein, variant 1 [Aphanomyces astaci]
MSSIRGLLQRKQDGSAVPNTNGDMNEHDGQKQEGDGVDDDSVKPTEQKKKGGFGFGSLVAPKFMTGLKNLNPLKNFSKKSEAKPGTRAPPPPLKQIVWLFGPKHRAELWQVCPFLPLNALGCLAQVNEAANEHMIAYFRSPLLTVQHVLSTRFLVFQTLLRDHTLSRNRVATDYDIPSLVLAYLPMKEQVHMSQVCRRLAGIYAKACGLHLCGRHQLAAFLRGYDVESKAFWTVRARYGRIRHLSCAYVTATQLVLVTWLLLHDCFPNVTSISFSHVTMEGGQTSAIDLATSLVTMLEHMGKGQLDSIVLRGIPWTDPAYAILVDHLYFHPLTNLKHLDLADSPLPHVTWVRMTPSFVRDHFAHLTSFDVQNTALTSESFPALLHVLAHMPHLMHLNISRNELAIGAWKDLAAHMLLDPAVSVFHTLRSFDCSGCSYNIEGMLVFMDALWQCTCPHLSHLNVSGNVITKDAIVGLSRAFVHETVPSLSHLNLASTALTSECIQMLSAGFTGRLFYHTSKKIHHDMPGQSLSYLNLTGNVIGKGVEFLLAALKAHALASIDQLVLAKTHLGTSEFDLLAQTFQHDCCPQLTSLDLSDNQAKGEGLTRFCYFFSTPAAARVRHLDLSHNLLDTYSIHRLSETLRRSQCIRLHTLNVARNYKLEFQTLYHFNETVRSGACPSLRCLQIGDAVTPDAGHRMVQRLNQTASSLDVVIPFIRLILVYF